MSNTRKLTGKKFRREAKQYHIVWPEDTDNEGLEVLMRSLPIGEFLTLTDLASQDKTDTNVARELFRIFAGSLLEWNLTDGPDDDHQEDVPATYEGVVGQDLDFILSIVMRWMAAMSAVDNPLPDDSNDAETLGSVSSLPTENL
jgi:hypothetical protein